MKSRIRIQLKWHGSAYLLVGDIRILASWWWTLCCEYGSLNITAVIFHASKSRHLKVFCKVRLNWNLFFFEEKKVTKKFNNLTKLKRSCHTGIAYISKCTLCTLILTQSIVFLSNSLIIMRSKFRLQLREQQFALSVWG